MPSSRTRSLTAEQEAKASEAERGVVGGDVTIGGARGGYEATKDTQKKHLRKWTQVHGSGARNSSTSRGRGGARVSELGHVGSPGVRTSNGGARA
jgi:hypothetical protein